MNKIEYSFLLYQNIVHNFALRREIENLEQFKEYSLYRNYCLKTSLGNYVTVFYDVIEDIWNLVAVKFMQ